MFKDTCLIALKRKDWSPRILVLEILVYLLLEVFIYLILKSLFIGFKMISPNAQAYNHTNARNSSKRKRM
jgi:hypothetical protein